MTRQIRMSGLRNDSNAAETLEFSLAGYGQSYPQYYPQPGEPLGAPLSIREASEMIGCSMWTVRQRYLPQGLPHLRSGPQGKLIFFRDQVIRWILERQQKGGM
jgi:hypothetical protein